MRLLPSVMKARSLAKRLIRYQALKAVYIPKSREETPPSVYTRLLGVNSDFENNAREEWDIHLRGWDLTVPEEREQLRRIILSAMEEAVADARRSLPDEEGIRQLFDAFSTGFDPETLFRAPVGAA